MTRFTVSEVEQLIELVGGHPVLWNMADNDQFKNIVKKDLVWQEIDLLVNKTGNKTMVVISSEAKSSCLLTCQQSTNDKSK